MSKKLLRKKLGRVTFFSKVSLAVAGSVLLQSVPASAENPDFPGGRGAAFREFKQFNEGLSKKEINGLFKVHWAEIKNSAQAVAQPIFEQNANNLQVQNAANTNVNANLSNFSNQPNFSNQSNLTKQELKLERQALKQELREAKQNFNHTVQQISADRMIRVNGGFSLDLSSAVENITLGDKLFQNESSITISIGGETKTLSAGSKVTAAEYVAAKQVLATGGQKVGLDNNGRAVSGSIDLAELTPGDKTMKVRDFIVPENVSASGDFAKNGDIRITGDLINSGTIQAFSSDTKLTTATIAADNITNNANASITSELNQTARDLGGVVSSLGLNLRADDALSNYGSITSSGDLTLSAGKFLSNSGLNSQLSAVSDVTINSPLVNNGGTVVSSTGNIQLLAPQGADLKITNFGGTICANNGSIGVGLEQIEKVDTNLSGGRWIASELNIRSGNGRATLDANEVTARVNMRAGEGAITVQSGNLTLGDLQFSGDPLISSPGDLTLSGDIFTDGGPLSIIAGGSIFGGSASTISTQNTNGRGGRIVIVAGANYSVSGNTLTIHGGTAAGGDVSLGSLTTLTSDGTTQSGSIQIVAYGGVDKGHVDLSGVSTISLLGAPGAQPGDFYVIAGATSGTAIHVQNIDTGISQSVGGSIQLSASVPEILVPLTFDITTGATLGGFKVGSIATGGNIIASNLTAHSSSIVLSTNGSVQAGHLNVSSVAANQATGGVRIVSGSAGSVSVGNIDAVPTGNISNVSVSINSGSGGLNVGTISIHGPTVAGYLTIAAHQSAQLNLGPLSGQVVNISNTGTLSLDSISASTFNVSTVSGNIIFNDDVSAGTFNISSGNTIVQNSGKLIGELGNLSLSFSSGSVSLNTRVNRVSATALASSLTINEDDTVILDGINVGTLVVNAGSATVKGDIFAAFNPVTANDVTLNTLNENGDIGVGTTLTGAVSINLNAGNEIRANGIGALISGGSLSVAFNELNTTLNTNIATLTASSAPGCKLVINENSGISILGAQNVLSLTVNAGSSGNGDIFLPESLSIPNLTLVASNGRISQTNGTTITASELSLAVGRNTSTLSTSVDTLKSLQSSINSSIIVNEADSINIEKVSQIGTAVINASTTSAGTLTLTQSTTGPINSIALINSAGDIVLNGGIGGQSVTLNASGTIKNDVGPSVFVSGGSLSLTYGTGSLNLKVFIDKLTTYAPGCSLVVTADKNFELSDQNIGSLVVNAQQTTGGDLRINGVINADVVSLHTTGGADVLLNSNISAATSLVIDTDYNGDIVQISGVLSTPNLTLTTVGGSITGAAGSALQISNGTNSISANVQNDGANDVNLISTGSGALTLLGGKGANYKVSALGAITVADDIEANGDIVFVTNQFTNEHTISGRTISISSNGDGLIVDGGSGGVLSGISTSPLPGQPGHPNQSTIILTAGGGALVLKGQQTLYGDASFFSSADSVVVYSGANWQGENNVSVNVDNVVLNGTLDGNALLLNFQVFGNIVNTVGDINLTSNIITNGTDIAIIAAGNINAGNIIINLNSTSGNGGSLYMIAGYNAEPSSGGTLKTDETVTLTSPSSGGSINMGSASISSRAMGKSGEGGDIVLVAQNGSVNIGSVLTGSEPVNPAGDITIIGENGVTAGSVVGASNLTIAVASPEVVGGPISFTAGTKAGGSFVPSSSATSGDLLVNTVSGGEVRFIGGASSSDKITCGQFYGNLHLDAGSGSTELQNAAIGALYSNSLGTVNINSTSLVEVQVASGATQKLNLIAPNLVILSNVNVGELTVSSGTINIVNAIIANDISLTSTGNSWLGNGLLTAPTLSLTQAGNIQSSFLSGFNLAPLVENVTVTSTGGNIGVNQADRFVLPTGFDTFIVNSLIGSVYLGGNSVTGAVQTVSGGFAAGSFDYLGAGATNVVGDISTVNGDINIVTATNKISVSSGVKLTAHGTTTGNGDITLRVLDTSKAAKNTAKITLAAGSQLSTVATGSDGVITLSVGAVSPPVLGKAPKKNVQIINQGGTIFWGKSGSAFNAPTNVLHTKGTNIVFNNTFGNKNIILSGATLFADPPVADGTPISVITMPSSESRGVVQNAADLSSSNSMAEKAHQLELSSVSVDSPITSFNNNIAASNLFRNSVLPIAYSRVSLLTESDSLVRAKQVRQLALNSSFENDNSYIVGNAGFSSAFVAGICTDAELGFVGDGDIQAIKHSENVKLSEGSVIFAPLRDTQVETSKGTVKVSANSIALISVSEAGLSVFDLDDQHKGSVTVEANGHNIVLSPGRHVMITPHHKHEFAQLNPIQTISHRGFSSTVKNGHRAHMSEFSVISALDTVKPLKMLAASRHPNARKIAGRMMKTTAILMQMSGSREQYQHYFRPQMTAKM